MSLIPYRLSNALHRAKFRYLCRGILETRPVRSERSAAVAVVTFLGRQDVLLYLAAIKSFLRYFQRRARVVTLSDGTLGDSQLQIIRSHITDIEIVSLDMVDPAACPKGNCWERLLLVCDLAREHHVVQLDSDIVTLGEIPEVLQSIDQHCSFTLLGDGSHPGIESFVDASARYSERDSSHVQVAAERAMAKIGLRDPLRYVRGNAGFAGFARGSFTKLDVERISEMFRRELGSAWNRWGTEQVTSNILIANAKKAEILPFPKYCSYYAHPSVNYLQECSLIHFIGAHRFENGMYAQSVRRLLSDLS